MSNTVIIEETSLALPSPAEWTRLLRTGDAGGPFIVIIYNDDWHTFDEVILQLRKATGCAIQKAQEIADEVHNAGRAVAYAGSEEQCEKVAAVLRQIRLQVETDTAM